MNLLCSLEPLNGHIFNQDFMARMFSAAANLPESLVIHPEIEIHSHCKKQTCWKTAKQFWQFRHLSTIPLCKKKCIRFENTPRRGPTIHIWCRMYSVSYTIGNPEKCYWPSDLGLWPMTSNFEPDLDILPLDLNTKIQVCMSVRLAMRVVLYRHTDTHIDDVKTITPDTSQTWGVIMDRLFMAPGGWQIRGGIWNFGGIRMVGTNFWSHVDHVDGVKIKIRAVLLNKKKQS